MKVKIKNIKKIGSDSKRYDIQTKTSNFFANDILVHNSLIQVYYDWVLDKWCVGTTGTAEAEGDVNGSDKTFAGLFWTAAKISAKESSEYLKTKFVKGLIYVFELTTPYNIIVTPHATSSITLLTIRNVKDLVEFNYDTMKEIASKYLYVNSVNSFSLKSDYKTLRKTFDNMKYSEEGYVVVDKNFDRVKIKNPAYVAAHHLKSSMAEYKIMSIIKTNEVDEFIASFPERKDEILKIRDVYIKFKANLESVWEVLKTKLPENITKEETKRYAMDVFKVCEAYKVKGWTGLYFSLKDKKVDTVNDYLMNYNDKHLYEICSKY
jgi:hypothetical protein